MTRPLTIHTFERIAVEKVTDASALVRSVGSRYERADTAIKAIAEHVGVDPWSVYRWARGKTEPSAAHLRRLRQFVEASAEAPAA